MKPSDKKKILRQNVSRRSFLKRAAVGAAVSGANLLETKTDTTEKIEAEVMEKDSYPATNSAPAKADFSTTLSSATISENDEIICQLRTSATTGASAQTISGSCRVNSTSRGSDSIPPTRSGAEPHGMAIATLSHLFKKLGNSANSWRSLVFFSRTYSV